MEEKKCVDRDELMKYMDSVYLPFAKDDFCHNGLQIEGSKDVSHIVCGVTISKRLIEAALERQAEMIVVHHGLFTFDMPNPPRITGYMKDRLKLILGKLGKPGRISSEHGRTSRSGTQFACM